MNILDTAREIAQEASDDQPVHGYKPAQWENIFNLIEGGFGAGSVDRDQARKMIGL